MFLSIVAFGCVALIGFAAHRASLCNVRAVAEVMTSGSAHMMWSLLQAVLWMTTLTGLMAVVLGVAPLPVWTHAARVGLGRLAGLADPRAVAPPAQSGS